MKDIAVICATYKDFKNYATVNSLTLKHRTLAVNKEKTIAYIAIVKLEDLYGKTFDEVERTVLALLKNTHYRAIFWAAHTRIKE